MESQIKQLKLNVTNIKSSLFFNNKQLKKLKIRERGAFRRQQIEKMRQQKESFVESQKSGGGVLGRLGSSLLSGPMSLFDKIKEFFGNILLGILVNNLPMIYDKITKFLEDNKDTIETIKSVVVQLGNSLVGFVSFIDGVTDNIDNIGKQWEQISKDLDEMLSSNGPLGLLTQGLMALDGIFKSEFSDLYVQKDPEQVREDVKTAVKENNMPRESFTKRLNEYRSAKNSANTTQKVVIPGLGTYQRKKGGFLNMFIIEQATDSYGASIPAQEFDTRFLDISGNLDSIYQGFSTGGTVKPKGSGGLESSSARKARESTQTFSTFDRNTSIQSGLLEIQDENNEKFEEMIKNFKTLRELSSKDDSNGGTILTTTPNTRPGGTPPGGTPPGGTIPPPDPSAQGPVITFDGGQGPDPREPGVDFSFADWKGNYAIFPGKVTEVGSLYGAGYGRHVVVRSTDSDGNKFDALYAHFGQFSVKEGDTVQAGTYLGTVGWIPDDPNETTGYGPGRPAPGAGNMTGPHTSVDFYEPNTRRGEITGAYRGKDKLINLILNSANKDVRQLNLLGPQSSTNSNNLVTKSITPKSKTSNSMIANLAQSFDGSEPEVLMVMAQQPIIVPGPTRYITRTVSQPMPFPVAIHPKSSGLRSLV